ncbi:MAG: bifunctional 4-hydroxy-2-oxoglutarate aldolase/2-dehydro-3-deoxy-phosphogluconate aldolase [Desulfobacterales bacterium]|nr:bifunctional 4-hydroxy-2-oxoglutarate aldolase/2-dehydro-3-deoxy-phosphogluconate aldolase [Desulfobacterales bacterium]
MQNKIYAIVRADNATKAIDISKALIDGGIKIIEIALGFENVSLVIKKLADMENIYVAAGSVITGKQAENAIDAGAQLIVSPVSEINLIKLCKGRAVNIITGASTPNEAYSAWKLGVGIIKLFPAKALGGADYVKNILTPMPFLPLMPTGGVGLDDFTQYFDAGAVAVGIGQAFYCNETNYSKITKNASITLKNLMIILKKNNI